MTMNVQENRPYTAREIVKDVPYTSAIYTRQSYADMLAHTNSHPMAICFMTHINIASQALEQGSNLIMGAGGVLGIYTLKRLWRFASLSEGGKGVAILGLPAAAVLLGLGIYFRNRKYERLKLEISEVLQAAQQGPQAPLPQFPLALRKPETLSKVGFSQAVLKTVKTFLLNQAENPNPKQDYLAPSLLMQLKDNLSFLRLSKPQAAAVNKIPIADSSAVAPATASLPEAKIAISEHNAAQASTSVPLAEVQSTEANAQEASKSSS